MLPHRMLIDEPAIRARVEQLAQAIAMDLGGRRPILLGLLTGSFMFLADLARALVRCGVEPEIDFVTVSHYGKETDPARPVRIEKRRARQFSGQALLVVDDILDSGRSIAQVVEYLSRQKPAWLRTCAFLDKPSRRAVSIKADYVGFEVPDVWLIGYGLDLGGEGRALPYVGAVEEGVRRLRHVKRRA